MEKKKVGVIALILVSVIGVSLAIFVSNSLVGGKGNEQEGVTVAIKGATLNVSGTLSFNDTDILPGHKTVSAIKVTATGDNELIPYNLVWKGTNSLKTTLNYTVYKTNNNVSVSATCNKKKKIENGKQILSEECSLANLESLGAPVKEGIIETSESETKITLIEDEFVTAVSDGDVKYYYIVLEYPNKNQEQNLDKGGSFSGVLTVEESSTLPDINILAAYIEQDDGTYKESKDLPTKSSGYIFDSKNSTCSNEVIPIWNYDNWNLILDNLNKSGTSCYLYFKTPLTMDEILAEYNVGTRGSFSSVYTSATTKTIFTASDGLGTSKYFAGAPTDNYVKFGGFYWRIIRMNGDKSTRLIYAGKASAIDGLANKQTVLANGYADNSTLYTQIKTSAFNATNKDNAYVGFKYATGTLRGTTNKSTILGELDTWYEANLKTNYGKYIDGSTGFCGDRTAYTNSSGTTSGGGTSTTATYYADYIRLNTNKSPVLTCANSSDLYTTSGASRGNKALTNPVGLINANEVAMAGGVYGTANESYYLRTNNGYWTMSPSNFYFGNSYAYVFVVHANGVLGSNGVLDMFGVRPVINLASTTRFTGTGTWNDPFTVVEA